MRRGSSRGVGERAAFSHQTVEQLTAELQAMTEDEQRTISPSGIVARYLRRQRLAFLAGTETHSSVTRAAPSTPAPTHVLLLGADSREKLALAAQLQGRGAPARLDEAPLSGAEETEYFSRALELPAEERDAEGTSPQLRVLVPPASPAALSRSRAWYRELVLWCDTVVMCFTDGESAAQSRQSFEALQKIWIPLRREAQAQRQEEEEMVQRWHAREQRTRTRDPLGAADSLPACGWLAEGEVPLVLARLRPARTGHGAPRAVSREEVESVAQEAGATRTMELYSGSAAHARLLAQHCVLAGEAAYEDHPLSAQSSFTRAKAAALRLLLRAPPPRVRCIQHCGEALAERAASLSAAPSLPLEAALEVARLDGIRVWLRPLTAHTVRDGERDAGTEADREDMPLPPCVAATPRARELTTSLRLPPSPSDASGVYVYCTARCMYPSPAVAVAIPASTPQPGGYFDPASRCFVCTSAPQHLHYALDDEDRPHRARAGQPITIPLAAADSSGSDADADDLDGWRDETAARQPWIPWPGPSPGPRLLRLFGTSADAADALAPLQVSAAFTVPPVLPTPVITYAATERAVHIAPFPPPHDAAIRYTLDGSTPRVSSTEYTAPIPIDQSVAGEARPFRVRAALFPRICFASREAVLCIDSADPQTATHRSTQRSSRDAVAAARPARHVGAPATKAQRLREAFHTGRYVPPREPFDRSLHTSHAAPRPARSPSRQRRRGAPQRVEGRASSSATLDDSTLLAPARAASLRSISSRSGVHEDAARSPSSRQPSLSSVRSSSPAPRQRTITLPSFDPPICLSHVVLRTPGHGEGPAEYLLEARHPHGTRFVTVAWGELADKAGAQIIWVPEEMTAFPVRVLRCVCRGGGGRVEDLQVRGTPQ